MKKFLGIMFLAMSLIFVTHGTSYAQNKPRPVTYQDLMLGNISYDDSVGSISRKLNEAPKVKKVSNVITYDFSCIHVTEFTHTDRKSGWQMLILGNSRLQTPRGIHINSSLNDVINAYGHTPYKMEAFDDEVLYAYPISNANGSLGIEFFVNSSSNLVTGIRIDAVNLSAYKR